MKTTRTTKAPRRAICAIVGEHGDKLTGIEAIIAWRLLCESLQGMGEKDIPKFWDVLSSIRSATVLAKRGAKKRLATSRAQA